MVGNADTIIEKTKITNLTGKSKEEANAVRDVIKEDARLVTDRDEDSEVDFRVTIGEDY